MRKHLALATVITLATTALLSYGCSHNRDQQMRSPSGYDNTGMTGGSSTGTSMSTSANTATTGATAPSATGGGPYDYGDGGMMYGETGMGGSGDMNDPSGTDSTGAIGGGPPSGSDDSTNGTSNGNGSSGSDANKSKDKDKNKSNGGGSTNMEP